MLDLDKVPEAKVILDYLESRIKKRLACNIISTAELGKGKSYSNLRLLQLWYRRWFNEEFPLDHVCETLEEAVELVKNFNRPGEGIIIEEISVLASSRDSLTRTNKLFNKFMDTCRIKQAIIIMNAPFLSFIDKHIILLCQVWMENLGVNFRKNIGIAKTFILQSSQYKKEPYKHKFIDDEGEEVALVYFRKPENGLAEGYDKFKDESGEKLYDDLTQKLAKERIKQLKLAGDKVLSRRENEAWQLKLQGYSNKEGAEKMGLKEGKTFRKYVNNAKEKINFNKYLQNPKKMPKIAPKTL